MAKVSKDQTYYQRHRDEIREKQRLYHLTHKHIISRRKKSAGINYHLRLRYDTLQFLGAKCVMCGYDTDYRALQIDHVNGGGLADMRRFSSYTAYLKHVREVNGEGYQVLCANCNCIKRMEKRECLKKTQELLL